MTASDGFGAQEVVEHNDFYPDLILADYNLPGDCNGVEITRKLREKLDRQIPIIILTGDISTNALQEIALQDYFQMSKPVKPAHLIKVVQDLLAPANLSQMTRHPVLNAAETVRKQESSVIYVVDDDQQIREALREALERNGWVVEDFESCESFLGSYRPGGLGCLLLDAYLPEMSGVDLLKHLMEGRNHLPVIIITGAADVTMAVEAMRTGAVDFLQKPISHDELIGCVTRALEQAQDKGKLMEWQKSAAAHVSSLTGRQREIMDLVVAGHPSKNIAADLGISQRTVENHRASIMKKMGAKSIPELARLALTAASSIDDRKIF
jgi:two-component system CheB/CheR fusion protein